MSESMTEVLLNVTRETVRKNPGDLQVRFGAPFSVYPVDKIIQASPPPLMKVGNSHFAK